MKVENLNSLGEIAARYNIVQVDEDMFKIRTDENTTVFVTKPFKIEADKYAVTLIKDGKWLMLWKDANVAIVKL
jgi:helix-turn-helix protein